MKSWIFSGYWLLIGGCVSRSVERSVEPFSPEEVKECIACLEKQSFEFEIRLKKPGVNGRFKGVANKGDARVEGFWEFDGKREKIKVIGIGEKEYKWENGKWQESSRTNMSNPVATLELVCSVGEWKFKESARESFIYAFKPNLLFMDPGLTEAEGLIWINAETRVPEKVIAEAENIKWEFEIKNICEHLPPKFRGDPHGTIWDNIFNPLAKEQKIEMRVGVTTVEELRGIAQILKERFELYGFNEVRHELLIPKPKCKSRGNRLILYFLAQESLSESLIETLLQVGEIELYKANYVHNSEEAEYFVCGDLTKPVVLKEKLQQELVDTDFESGFIELTFDKELPEGESIAVVVDNEVIGFIPEVWGKEIKIEGDKEGWIKIKFPLPCQLTILKGGKNVR